jgi:hypothetical protein
MVRLLSLVTLTRNERLAVEFRELCRNFFEWMFSNIADGLGRRSGQRFRKRRVAVIMGPPYERPASADTDHQHEVPMSAAWFDMIWSKPSRSRLSRGRMFAALDQGEEPDRPGAP